LPNLPTQAVHLPHPEAPVIALSDTPEKLAVTEQALQDDAIIGSLSESLAVMGHQEAQPKPCVRPPGSPDVAEWLALYETFHALSVTDRVRLLDVARSLKTKQESMISIGLHDALVEADAVVGFNQGKHPGSKWRKYTAEQHIGKIMKHAGSALYGERIDPETGKRALAHVLARSAMALQIDLEESRRR
jgi:hypothetical protein